jgi:DNA recombination protein RmuC
MGAVALGVVIGALLGWAWARGRYRARLSAIEQQLEGERSFAQERRLQAERTDALLSQLASVSETHRQLSAQTQHLVDTLRSPVVRGQWGEMQLRRVCELAQMTEHVDFVLQDTGGSPSRLRPDLRVELPGDRTIVVDAKTPMQAFLDAMETVDELERAELLRQHARQVRDHVTRLGAKAYWEQLEGSPDFVVLFLPGEALFSTALQFDATLIEFGVSQRVMLASPTTLIALLRATAHGWQRVRATENAEAIRALGGELHDSIAGFLRNLDQVRSGLERATDGFNHAVGALDRRVLPKAHQLRDLGAAGRRGLDGPGTVKSLPVRAPELKGAADLHEEPPDMRRSNGDDDASAPRR